jgi:hypothetical protein
MSTKLPPGPDRRDSFVAETRPATKSHARRYLGVAAQGRSLKVVLLRVYLALLAAAQRCHHDAGVPAAWSGEATTTAALADTLSVKAGKPLPWNTVKAALNGAFQTRLLERAVDSRPWPCDRARCRVSRPAPS